MSTQASFLKTQASLGTVEAREFVAFLNKAPTPYHAVKESVDKLERAGFVRLREKEDWSKQGAVSAGGRYYITRNQSSLVAFTVPATFSGPPAASIVGTHTDSCCFKVRPVSTKESQGYLEVGVETYGGGLWQTWVDRDLSLAGRVFLSSSSSSTSASALEASPFASHLVHLPPAHPVLRIPTIAVHLTPGQGGKQEYNTETELVPVLGMKKGIEKLLNAAGAKESKETEEEKPKHHAMLLRLLSDHLTNVTGTSVSPAQIYDFDISLYDTQPAVIGGAGGEFVFGPRLDNLVSTWAAVEGLVRSVESGVAEKTGRVNVIACWDNEEIGSESAYGADSNLLRSVLTRISLLPLLSSHTPTSLESFTARSFLLSCDMAHAVHPNFPSKHEENHRPKLNDGVVVKTNAKIRYASTGETRVLLKRISGLAAVPLQEFEVRNDMPCGSTIGPIVSKIGLRTVDIGCPQLSMHSIRETAGTEDITYLVRLFDTFFERFGEVDAAEGMLGE